MSIGILNNFICANKKIVVPLQKINNQRIVGRKYD